MKHTTSNIEFRFLSVQIQNEITKLITASSLNHHIDSIKYS